MKRIDLDRAFPETPDCVRASIQLAFQKGARQQMKMRSKTMSLLAVAAALALLAGVAALAAGRLGAPRPDNVTLGQPVFKATPTAEPTVASTTGPTVYCAKEGKYYHLYEDCSGMQNASATTLSEAQAQGKQPCPVCMGEQNEAAIDGELSNLAAEPESYDVFLKVFGHPLSTFFPGFEFERSYIAQTRPDGFVDVVDWYVSDGKQEQPACTVCYLDYDGVRKASQFIFDFKHLFDHRSDVDFNQINNAGVSEKFIQLAPEPLHTALAACRKRLPTAPDYLSICLDEDYNVRLGHAICWGSEDQNGVTPQKASVEWLQTPDGEIRILKSDYGPDGFDLEEDTEEILHAPIGKDSIAEEDDLSF